jgi:hypothetical protein
MDEINESDEINDCCNKPTFELSDREINEIERVLYPGGLAQEEGNKFELETKEYEKHFENFSEREIELIKMSDEEYLEQDLSEIDKESINIIIKLRSAIKLFERLNCSSESGFLQKGQKLLNVIKTDEEYLKSVGITNEQIVGYLNHFINKNCIFNDLKINITGRYPNIDFLEYIQNKEINDSIKIITLNGIEYEVTSIGYKGYQRCPFAKDPKENYAYRVHHLGSTDYQILNKTTGKSIKFSNLIIHLIADHHFYEGPGCIYRLNPADVIEIFDIKSGIDAPCFDLNYDINSDVDFSRIRKAIFKFINKDEINKLKAQIPICDESIKTSKEILQRIDDIMILELPKLETEEQKKIYFEKLNNEKQIILGRLATAEKIKKRLELL